jgi:RNA polymerase sigma factor (sigma-70 family)
MAEHMGKARERIIDELLVTRCQEGRREAFDLLVRRWQRRLWRYARSLTASDHAAWDVTQETWIAILKQVRKLGDPAWFGAWAYRIVRNKCADHCRRAGRQRRLAEGLVRRQSTGGRVGDPVPTTGMGDPMRTGGMDDPLPAEGVSDSMPARGMGSSMPDGRTRDSLPAGCRRRSSAGFQPASGEGLADADQRHGDASLKPASEAGPGHDDRRYGSADSQPAEATGASGEQTREGPYDALAEALRRLPADRQELLALRYAAGLNIVEIAVVLGIPAGTVKSRLHHAREKLRRMLEGDAS